VAVKNTAAHFPFFCGGRYGFIKKREKYPLNRCAYTLNSQKIPFLGGKSWFFFLETLDEGGNIWYNKRKFIPLVLYMVYTKGRK
jgi:hypothetical protein